MWDLETQLTKEEEEMQVEYAEKIVKSIFARESDPLKLRILLHNASDTGLEIMFEASKLVHPNVKKEKENASN